ncbi:pyrimidine 5'-nucleotidase [Yoonia litorea]|uniref:Putative hydrolase of the HAD superfamily n=1 Tax=Yoonia litorea TaxID=1123755 RepID=A0A1I6MEQ9_9RHOB|nr:pyrimidine 5'-nucleotidase [Yoonia litorea]SFS14113.1 putative hydrolase of the HAD superfamily [Yoonia litorea]
MVAQYFAHVDTWVFDLDNTLYHPSANLFGQMDVRFSAYVQRLTGLDAEGALRLCHDYWDEYGSTLVGLIEHHDVDPHHFLADVHDIDISHLEEDEGLIAALQSLSGRRIVYTNGSENHAKRVLAQRGLTRLFDAVYGVEHAAFAPKPTEGAFARVFAKDGLDPKKAAMFEDEARNLAVPHRLGMRTVHVHREAGDHDFVHHHSDDLTEFLSQLAR